MPLAVVVLGAAAAFATNAQSEKAEAPMIGYFYDHTKPVGQKCQPIEVDCNNLGSVICTNEDNSEQYWAIPEETGLSCTDLLYRDQ